MSNYKDKTCIYCQKVFNDDDDIVVCPECGAPHHRECYVKLGHCAQENLHNSDEQWCKKNKIALTEQNNQIALKPDKSEYTKNNTKNEKIEDYMAENGNFFKYGTMEENEEILGVSAKELSAFVGNKAYYYLTKFSNLTKSKFGISWNGASFLFTFLYFFYRKLYKQGLALLVVFVITFIPSLLMVGQCIEFIAKDVDLSTQMTLPDASDVVDKMLDPNTNPEADKFNIYANLSSMMMSLRFGIAVAVGFTTNRLYLSHALKKIKYTRAALPNYKSNPDYFKNLNLLGGTNMPLPIFILMGLLTMTTVITFIQWSMYL